MVTKGRLTLADELADLTRLLRQAHELVGQIVERQKPGPLALTFLHAEREALAGMLQMHTGMAEIIKGRLV